MNDAIKRLRHALNEGILPVHLLREVREMLPLLLDVVDAARCVERVHGNHHYTCRGRGSCSCGLDRLTAVLDVLDALDALDAHAGAEP